MSVISQKIIEMKQLISQCEKQYHRNPGSVSLLAVSKGQSTEKMLEAIDAGQRAFGENYLQEALKKILTLQKQDIEWHFLGPIQSNKIKKIAEHFHWVHSIEKKSIAKGLNDSRPASLPPLNICLQVNTSGEATKSGVDFDAIFSLAEYCLTLPNIRLRGLMTIPEPTDDPIKQRAEFSKLRILFEKLRKEKIVLDTLSMGMSNDWQMAVAEGATWIRIGTAIFGARN